MHSQPEVREINFDLIKIKSFCNVFAFFNVGLPCTLYFVCDCQ